MSQRDDTDQKNYCYVSFFRCQKTAKRLVIQLKVDGRNHPYNFNLRCVLIPVIDGKKALPRHPDLTDFRIGITRKFFQQPLWHF